MHSSTLFLLLTAFLVALTISVSAYPGEEKEKEMGEGEGEKKLAAEEGEIKVGKKDVKEEDKKEEKNGAVSLFSSNGLSTIMSLAIASLIFSIH